MIEKYQKEIDSLSQDYEKTILIQKETFDCFKKRIEKEIEEITKKVNKDKVGKKTERMVELVRELATKEAAFKQVRKEIKDVKIAVGKGKIERKKLKKRIVELEQVIEDNPRAKRALERQRDIKRYSPSKGLDESEETGITMKEHNELLEKSIALKLEVNKTKNAFVQLEESTNKLKSKF